MMNSNDFNSIQFTKAEKEILALMQEGKNADEISKSLNKQMSTIVNQLQVIYNKTKDVVKYGSKVKRFLTLQFFLTDIYKGKIDAQKDSLPKKDKEQTPALPKQQTEQWQRFNFVDEQKKESVSDTLNRLQKENTELKARIKELENYPPPKIDFGVLKEKIRADIEKLSQKLRLIEELEELTK